MNTLFRLLPIVILFSLFVSLSSGVFAQGSNDNTYSNPQLYTEDGSSSQTVPVGTTSGNSPFNIDWRWVLPLVLVGVGLFFVRGSSNEGSGYKTSSSNYDVVAYHEVRGEGKKDNKKLLKSKKPLRIV